MGSSRITTTSGIDIEIKIALGDSELVLGFEQRGNVLLWVVSGSEKIATFLNMVLDVDF